jgi:hypothetical protein
MSGGVGGSRRAIAVTRPDLRETETLGPKQSRSSATAERVEHRGEHPAPTTYTVSLTRDRLRSDLQTIVLALLSDRLSFSQVF